MARSIRSNSTAVTGIATTYDKAKFLVIDKTLVGAGGLCPIIDRIAVTFTDVAGASTTIKGTLWWDANGDYYAIHEFTFTRATGLTTTTRFTAIAVMADTQLLPMPPGRTAEGTLYLGLTCGANTIAVAADAAKVWTRDDRNSLV